jgi:hypothetical protein
MARSPQPTDRKALKDKPDQKLTPRNAMRLDTLAGVRGEMSRLYRLGIGKRLPLDEMTKLIYALREIRSCVEAESLDDIGARLAALTARVEQRRHA